MKKINNNDPAFPGKQARMMIPKDLEDDPRIHGVEVFCNGMTRRQWLAGMVLSSGNSPYNSYKVENTAEWCFQQADAVLAYEKKEQ